MTTERFMLQRNGLYSSFEESLNEEQCFIPFASFTVRKTNSMNDISRFYRYFDLIESNSETLITWKTYLQILQDQLRSYETLTIMSKMMVRKIETSSQLRPEKSTASNKTKTRKQQGSSKSYHENVLSSKKKSVIFKDCGKVAGDTFIIDSSVDENLSDVSSQLSPKKLASSKKTKTRKLQDSSKLNHENVVSSKKKSVMFEDCGKVAGDTFIIESFVDENLSDVSDRSDISIYTRARLLKSICTETKILAEKICKTVDRISRLPKKCSTCGGSMRGSRHFKQCVRDSEMIGDSFIMEPADTKSKKLSKTKTQGGSMDSSYFSRKSTPDGESSGSHLFKKFNPLKKSSVKRLTYLFVKH